MNVVFWFLARFAVAAGVISLLTGHTEAGATFGFLWVFFSSISWLLTPLPEPKRPASPATPVTTSVALAQEYQEASQALTWAARQHRDHP